MIFVLAQYVFLGRVRHEGICWRFMGRVASIPMRAMTDYDCSSTAELQSKLPKGGFYIGLHLGVL